MKQTYQVKITLPNGQDRLLSMNEKTQDIAIFAAKLHLYQIMTEVVKLSSEQAAERIDDYAFAIADENDRLRLGYINHNFNQEDVVRCYQQ